MLSALTDFLGADISAPIGQGNNGVSHRPQDCTARTMASSGPSGLEGVFLIAFEQAESEVITVAHDGADEPNYGKAVMEREENSAWG